MTIESTKPYAGRVTRADLQLMYAGWGENWNVEIFARWSSVTAARTGTRRIVAHLDKCGIVADVIKGSIEPFSGTFEVVIRTNVTHDVAKVVIALETPLL